MLYLLPFAIPQCIMLGPLIFVIFINDLSKSIISSVEVFADDCLTCHTIYSQIGATHIKEDDDQLGLLLNG